MRIQIQIQPTKCFFPQNLVISMCEVLRTAVKVNYKGMRCLYMDNKRLSSVAGEFSKVDPKYCALAYRRLIKIRWDGSSFPLAGFKSSIGPGWHWLCRTQGKFQKLPPEPPFAPNLPNKLNAVPEASSWVGTWFSKPQEIRIYLKLNTYLNALLHRNVYCLENLPLHKILQEEAVKKMNEVSMKLKFSTECFKLHIQP